MSQKNSNVGILGSGEVGQTLAKAFTSVGYKVMIGSRSPDKLKDFVAQLRDGASAGSFEAAASFGDMLVLATHGDGTENAIGLASPKNFSGKVVIDSTNPLDFSKGMPPGVLSKYRETSLGEQVQGKLRDARVVKCFNTVPNSQMFRPKFGQAEMLICGNDATAKQDVTRILKEFGWSGSVDVGGIDNAVWLEALAVLWVRAAVATGNFNSMFQFVVK